MSRRDYREERKEPYPCTLCGKLGESTKAKWRHSAPGYFQRYQRQIKRDVVAEKTKAKMDAFQKKT